jgi:hypothetical protein
VNRRHLLVGGIRRHDVHEFVPAWCAHQRLLLDVELSPASSPG